MREHIFHAIAVRFFRMLDIAIDVAGNGLWKWVRAGDIVIRGILEGGSASC